MTIRLVQIQKVAGGERRVGHVEETQLRLMESLHTVYDLAQAALARGTTLADVIEDDLGDRRLNYEDILTGAGGWKVLVPLDHPEPARCIVSGTGLTHLGSAKNRDSMHEKIGGAEANLTDSMKMFRWGVEAGKPAKGKIGIAPEWFFKGNGNILQAHGEALEIPPHAEGGGEEAEIAGVYIIDAAGQPVRIGMTQGNEFSDHCFEKRNYLNLAGSKLRNCAIGPELVINPDFTTVPGTSRILREEKVLWEKAIATGQSEMCHSLANIEHHHFKFEGHRRPGDVHVHFYGACALSFGDGVELRDGDIMEVAFENFGRPLRNVVRVSSETQALIFARPLT